MSLFTQLRTPVQRAVQVWSCHKGAYHFSGEWMLIKQLHKWMPSCHLRSIKKKSHNFVIIVGPLLGKLSLKARWRLLTVLLSRDSGLESRWREQSRQPSTRKAPGKREIVSLGTIKRSVCFNNTFLVDFILIGIFHNNFFYSIEYRKDLESSIEIMPLYSKELTILYLIIFISYEHTVFQIISLFLRV